MSVVSTDSVRTDAPAFTPAIQARTGSRSTAVQGPRRASAMASPPIPQHRSSTGAAPKRAAFHAATTSLVACSRPARSSIKVLGSANLPEALPRAAASSIASATGASGKDFRRPATDAGVIPPSTTRAAAVTSGTASDWASCFQASSLRSGTSRCYHRNSTPTGIRLMRWPESLRGSICSVTASQ